MNSDGTILGRPRSFDEADALEKAMQVFWSHGFAGASYPALEAATGLHRQSLRYAFGDKAALFERVIGHYADRKVGGVAAILSRSGAALDNVRAVFELWGRDANHPSRHGCLMVNALAELGNGGMVAVKAIDGPISIRRFSHARPSHWAMASWCMVVQGPLQSLPTMRFQLF